MAGIGRNRDRLQKFWKTKYLSNTKGKARILFGTKRKGFPDLRASSFCLIASSDKIYLSEASAEKILVNTENALIVSLNSNLCVNNDIS